ncbi:30S ribosomal protein S17 [Candidatus Sumerlaeota bacterium]|nr:30S ribosomal protein S17 [Candidatus Sumerlaeota bacterium]
MADTATETKAVKPQPKKRTGKVTSDKMDKTIIVSIDRLVKHRLYKKYIRRSKKLYVHDEARTAKTGDTVEVAEVTRPLSKLKRWRLVRVVERAK